MSRPEYSITWHDDRHTRGCLTEKRDDEPDRIAEVELRVGLRTDLFTRSKPWTCVHAGTDVEIYGNRPNVWHTDTDIGDVERPSMDDEDKRSAQWACSRVRMNWLQEQYDERERAAAEAAKNREASQWKTVAPARNAGTELALARVIAPWWRRMLARLRIRRLV